MSGDFTLKEEPSVNFEELFSNFINVKVALSKDQVEKLNRIADESMISIDDVIRSIVEEFLDG